MQSLKSSVGSKSSNLPLAGRGGDDTSLSFPRPAPLRSSWVSRLRQPPLPPPPGPAAGHSASTTGSPGGIVGRGHTVSTHESRIPASIGSSSAFVFRRYLSLLAQKPPPLARAGGGETPQVTGFGPFQVRTQKALPRRADRNREQSVSLIPQRRVIDHSAGVVPMSPFFQFRPRLNAAAYQEDSRVGAHVEETRAELTDNDPTTSWNTDYLRPAHDHSVRASSPVSPLLRRELMDESTSQRPFDQKLPAVPWRTSQSVQHVARSRGTIHHDSAGDPSTYRNFSGLHSLHQNIIPQPDRQTSTCWNEPEEPFTFWNMGRFKRKNIISSVSPAITLAKNLGRKRNPSTDVFVSSKFRKLGSEN